MRDIVEALCSDRCAGRAAGSAGGRLARQMIVERLRALGLDPQEQPIPRIGGANVLATIPGDVDRWVMIAAHYDHLGVEGHRIFRGADDNAASVAVLLALAEKLATQRPTGRGVILAAFDAEEQPNFANDTMGSMHYVRHPSVPLASIDMMVCLELVGHALGAEALPREVRETMFLLGAERSIGTRERVIAMARAQPGLIVRPADAEVIPPLSDYLGFWERKRPFVLLTGGRTRHYHTPSDLPEHLDFARLDALARWLERFVRGECGRDERLVVFSETRDDVTTLDTLRDVLTALAPFSEEATRGLSVEFALRRQLRRDRSLPDASRAQLAQMIEGLEMGLA